MRTKLASMLRMLNRLTKTPRRFQENPLTVVDWLARPPVSRSVVSLTEAYVLRKSQERRPIAGPDGRATGYLFHNQEPGKSAIAIYREDCSPERYEEGYQSQMGQKMFLDR